MSQTIIDESIAKIIFTKEQIKAAKESDGTLSSDYILNKQTNPIISKVGNKRKE